MLIRIPFEVCTEKSLLFFPDTKWRGNPVPVSIFSQLKFRYLLVLSPGKRIIGKATRKMIINFLIRKYIKIIFPVKKNVDRQGNIFHRKGDNSKAFVNLIKAKSFNNKPLQIKLSWHYACISLIKNGEQ